LLGLKLPDWCRDFGWREHGGSHLIEERLKDVMVALINQNDFRISSSEGSCRSNAGKTAPDDNNAGSRGFRGWRWRRVFSLIIRGHCAHNGHQI
jgi:hypothetical protein